MSAPDAPSIDPPAALLDTTGDANGNGAPPAQQQQHADSLTLRSLISTKDAGIIIGKGGQTVEHLRKETNVNAGVSKLIQGVHERVLSVSGSVPNVAKAYTVILHQLVTSAPTSAIAPAAPSNHTIIRLLISHNLMGTIIGRGGIKIKNIQDVSGARMVAQKDMLPQSTERIVEVQGSPDNIGRAIEEIGKCLLEDWERGLGTVLYQPGSPGTEVPVSLGGLNNRRATAPNVTPLTGNPGAHGFSDHGRRLSMINENTSSNGTLSTNLSSTPPTSLGPKLNPSNNGIRSPPTTGGAGAGGAVTTQEVAIPADMVGCIIGRGGSKIEEIRRLCGCQITIAKHPHDETGDRKFTIVGHASQTEKALFMLYSQLESEKQRRTERNAAQAEAEKVGGIDPFTTTTNAAQGANGSKPSVDPFTKLANGA